MKIAVVQMDIRPGEVSANLAHAEQLICGCPGMDLYVLPEMFSTGFDMHPDTCAENPGGAALQWMRRMAQHTGAAICGSVAVSTELFTFVNRLYFVGPDGSVTKYDKRHLFTFSGEDKHYMPGDERVVATYDGVRILLEVCYDLRFPVWSRCRDDYDVAVYVACWPTRRRMAWDVLLRARAIENQAYVVGANRVGVDATGCAYDGGSMLIGPYGEILAQVEDGAEGVAVADIDLQHVADYRRKFPSLTDADDFSLLASPEDERTSPA